MFLKNHKESKLTNETQFVYDSIIITPLVHIATAYSTKQIQWNYHNPVNVNNDSRLYLKRAITGPLLVVLLAPPLIFYRILL